MTPPITLGRGYQHLSNEDNRGMTWEGLSPSQGGPAAILVEAVDGPMSALLATRMARTVVPWLGQGALAQAQEHFSSVLRGFRAEAPVVTILAVHGSQALVATSGSHRVVSHRDRWSRLLKADPLRPRISQITWRPGSCLVALARGTGAVLPMGVVTRTLQTAVTPHDACRHLVQEAQARDPQLHHGAVLLSYPEVPVP